MPLDLSDVDADLLDAFADRFDPRRAKDGMFASDDEIMLFVHVPKTAGTSLGGTLQEAYDLFRPVAWDNPKDSFAEQVEAAYADRSVGRQVIIGHYGWNVIRPQVKQGRVVQCGAFVRDPAERLASNYDYNRSAAHPRREEFSAKHPTFEDFIDFLPANFQSLRLAGHGADLGRVIQTAVKHYTFIGLTEAFGASLDHFGRTHGLDGLTEMQKNRASRGGPRTQLTPELRERIYEKHAEDLRLVRLLKGFYGV